MTDTNAPVARGSLAEAALKLIPSDSVVGMGSGRAATAFVEALASRVRQGLRIHGVPTSQATTERARQLGIPLIALENVNVIDIAVDGADEVDPNLNLIKGLGGALVREKIVASAARKLVILVGEAKLVPVLGSHGVLPIEVVPFGLAFCRRKLHDLGYPSTIREVNGRQYVTDNGNAILDCQVSRLADPMSVERAIRAVPGVVGTGLFLGMADTVLVAEGDEVRAYHRKA